jgi:phage regulator Rha-like protein
MLPMQSNQKTMSTREIARLTSKDHKNVLRTIRSLIDQNIVTQIEPLKYEYKNQFFDYYELSKRDSLVLVARLSPQFTAAVVDRWQELESMEQFKIPKTFSEAMQLAADQAKQLEIQAPKVAVYEMLADRKCDVSTTIVAKELGTTAIKLNKFLRESGVKMHRIDAPKAGYEQWFNFVSDVKNGHEFTQCLITPRGQIEIATLWGSK